MSLKDPYGNDLHIEDEDINVPQLGMTLAEAIRQNRIDIPDEYKAQLKNLQEGLQDANDSDAHIHKVEVELTTDDTGQRSASSSYSKGTLTITLVNMQGDKGEKGEKGDTGETGAKGEKGDKGDTGETGPAGPTGAAGKDGEITNLAQSISSTDTTHAASGKAVAAYVADHAGADVVAGENVTITTNSDGSKTISASLPSGTAQAASEVAFTESDGTQTTLQTKVTELDEQISEIDNGHEYIDGNNRTYTYAVTEATKLSKTITLANPVAIGKDAKFTLTDTDGCIDTTQKAYVIATLANGAQYQMYILPNSTYIIYDTNSEITQVKLTLTAAKVLKSGTIIFEIADSYVEATDKGLEARVKGLEDIVGDGYFPITKYTPLLMGYKCHEYVGYDGTYEPLTFALAADVHQGYKNMDWFCKFVQIYKSYLDDGLVLGDICGYDYPDYTDFNTVDGYGDLLFVLGNHDTYVDYPTSTTHVDYSDCYTRYFSNNIGNWDVEQGGTDKMYYYKDYVSSKIRLIVLDDQYWDDTQREWLQNVLYGDDNTSSALALGYHVIIANHVPMFNDTDDITKISCSFTNLVTSTDHNIGEISNNADDSLTDVDTFIGKGGQFVTWLWGHWHKDVFGLLNKHNNQPFLISTSTAQNKSKKGHLSDDSYLQSKNDFNVISIDTALGLMRIAKVGVEIDIHGRRMDNVVYDYVNHELLK